MVAKKKGREAVRVIRVKDPAVCDKLLEDSIKKADSALEYGNSVIDKANEFQRKKASFVANNSSYSSSF